MRLPWRKAQHGTSANEPSMTLSQAARSGPDGDGKEHDLEYWLNSGFLALPKDPGRTGV